MNNDDLIPRTPNFQNPLQEVLNRLNQQETVNQELAKLNRELVALLRTLATEQANQSELLTKVVNWIAKQPQ